MGIAECGTEVKSHSLPKSRSCLATWVFQVQGSRFFTGALEQLCNLPFAPSGPECLGRLIGNHIWVPMKPGTLTFHRKKSVLESQTAPLIPCTELATGKYVKTSAFSFLCQDPSPTVKIAQGAGRISLVTKENLFCTV